MTATEPGTNGYQPRTPERLIEILRGRDINPRSIDREAASTIERLRRLSTPADQAVRNPVIDPSDAIYYEGYEQARTDLSAEQAVRSDLARELRDDYPAVDVTTVSFGGEFAGKACCVIPQDRVLAIVRALDDQAVREATIEDCAQIAERNGWEATADQIRSLSSTTEPKRS